VSGTSTVIYDACVLYPSPLRSLLMYLAPTGLFRARWSAEIHAEWMRSVCRDYPDVTQAQVERIRDLMNDHVRDCLVTGYESLIPTLTLPDPDDRHVLAAAIHAGADVIVTANLADFPAAELSKYGVGARHPDDFISGLIGSGGGGGLHGRQSAAQQPEEPATRCRAVFGGARAPGADASGRGAAPAGRSNLRNAVGKTERQSALDLACGASTGALQIGR
jgi:PIN domain